MLVRENRHKPCHAGASICATHSARWALPFHALEWVFQWIAYYLSRWALLEVLEYLGSLSVLVAVIFYFAESGDRLKQKHYQAWQVINTAQGKGGSGGRIEALSELNEDGVPLVGVDVSGAFLQGVRLIKAELSRFQLRSRRSSRRRPALRAIFRLRQSSFRQSARRRCLRRQFHRCRASSIPISTAPTSPAPISPTADLSDADLRNADLRGVRLAETESRRSPSTSMGYAMRRQGSSIGP